MRSVREATGIARSRVRSSPRLLAVGVVSTLASVAALFLADALLGDPGGSSFVGTTVHLVAIAGVVVLFRSLFVSVPASLVFRGVRSVDEGPDAGTTPRDGAGRRGRRSLVVAPVVVAAGLVVAVLAFVPALGVYAPLATLAQAAGYLVGVDPEAAFGLGILGVLLPVTAAGAVAGGTAGLVAPDVAGGEGLASALRRSLRRFAHSPRRALGHGIVVVGLVLAPVLVALPLALAFSVLGVEGSSAWGALLAVAALAGVGAYAIGPVYRSAAASTRSVDAGPRGHRSTRERPAVTRRRVVLSLALSGLVLGGVGAVRVADVSPGLSTAPPGYDASLSPDATVERGIEALSTRRRVVTRTVHERDPPSADREVTGRSVVRFDPPDREAFVAVYGRDPDPDPGDPRWSLRGRYVTATTELAHFGGIEGDSPPSVERLRSTETGWIGRSRFDLRYTPRSAGSDAWHSLDSVPEGTFQVAGSSPGEVVLETRDVEAYRRLEELNPDRVTDGYLRVVVDTDTGYPTRIVTHTVRVDPADEDGGPRVVHSVATIERRPVDVTRPPGAPPKGIVEYLYDALAY